ncbi:uncharacterized protein LOC143617210 [Bidens hawaiensis]|uniref:uncharacterized protein LOC143617210 n=1 Tax=Bidens hawaiensis TaxID=980011 RepID=UPI004049710C
MTHKHAFEALDRTLKDMLGQSGNMNNERPFGEKVVVFGGDFRQTLPVIQGGTRQEIVNASLCSSYLWGEGKLGGQNDGDATFDIPGNLLIKDTIDPISQLIDFVNPSILKDYENPNFFSEGALLAPTNEVFEEVNDREEKEYLSSDSICPDENVRDTLQENFYSPDVLNGLKISGMPNHKLVLKVGVPIMLLRNVDQKNGLCDGTRLQAGRCGFNPTGGNIHHDNTFANWLALKTESCQRFQALLAGNVLTDEREKRGALCKRNDGIPQQAT